MVAAPDLATESLPYVTADAPRLAERPHGQVIPLFAPADSPALRLTRRGRLAVAAVVLAVAAALLWIAARSAPAVTATGSAPAVVTVQVGDTLWSIAARVAPGVDPRAEVDALQRINHLSSVQLVPGQVLHTR